MAIHLHYIDSITPFLDEVIAPLIQKHIGFNLQDSFKILTPDPVTNRDLEERLLEDQRLGQVLIGKSVVSWSHFLDQALEDHPHRRPVASFDLEAKAFHLLLRKEGQDFGTQALRQTLRELKRQASLDAQQHPDRKTTRAFHPWFGAYQQWVREKFLCWTPEQAWDEVRQMISRGQCRIFSEVEELFLIGFPYPTADLLHLLQALNAGYPGIRVYLFLPPPERYRGGEVYFQKILQGLEKILSEQIHHQKMELPPLHFSLFPTPWHEAQDLWRQLQSGPQGEAFLLSPTSPTAKYLRSWLGMDPGHLHNPSRRAWEILQESQSETPGETLTFQDYFSRLFPRLMEERRRLAGLGDPRALKSFEDFYELFLEMARVETYHEEIQRVEDWVRLLQEKLEAPTDSQGDFGPYRENLRSWRRPGLKSFGKLRLAALNETPPGRAHGILELPSTYAFDLFEEKLLLNRAMHLGCKAASLSWVGHDMSGRVLSPAAPLSYLTEDLDLPETDLQAVLGNFSHPYHLENLQREKERIHSPEGLDSGNLQDPAVAGAVGEKTGKRALSPSYLDDYARCPWRFMVRWHFRVDTFPEADLEIDPRLKGRWAHQLLERLYGAWMPKYFKKGALPPEPQLAEQVTAVAAQLGPHLLDDVDFTLNPQILADEWEKIQNNVTALVRRELEEWRESGHKLLPAALEWSYGLPPKPSVAMKLPGGASVALGGIIDRVDYDPEQKRFLVIDYKSSQSDVLSKALRDELSFQLLIYQMAVAQALFPEAESVGALYWDLKQLKKNQGMVCAPVYPAAKKRRGASKTFLGSEAYEELYQRLKRRLAENLEQILRGNYRLEPPDCQGSQCAYHEICRYRDQPDG